MPRTKCTPTQAAQRATLRDIRSWIRGGLHPQPPPQPTPTMTWVPIRTDLYAFILVLERHRNIRHRKVLRQQCKLSLDKPPQT